MTFEVKKTRSFRLSEATMSMINAELARLKKRNAHAWPPHSQATIIERVVKDALGKKTPEAKAKKK